MRKLGRLAYPTIRLSEALDVVRRLIRDGPASESQQFSIAELADFLGMHDGGAFRHKLSSLKAFGLLEGRGYLNATELGKDAALAKDDDVLANVAYNAFKNIDLLIRLYRRMPEGSTDDETFKHVLQLVSDVTPIEVESRWKTIKRLYDDGIESLTYREDYGNFTVEGRNLPSEIVPIPEAADRALVSARNVLVHGFPPTSYVLTDGVQTFSAPRTKSGLDLLRQYIKLLEAVLDNEEMVIGSQSRSQRQGKPRDAR